MRTIIRLARQPEPWIFLAIGGSVAVLGHGVLHLLISRAVAPAVANAAGALRPGRGSGVRHRHLPQRRRTAPDEPGRDDEWCNPKRQAVGEAPRPVTDRPGLAALLWIKAPGESDGVCGGEQTYQFTPTQARTLITGAQWLPAADRAAARAARPAPVVDQN